MTRAKKDAEYGGRCAHFLARIEGIRYSALSVGGGESEVDDVSARKVLDFEEWPIY